MSVLVNLLPDLRLQKQREKQRRQLLTGIALLVVAVCGGFLVLMFVITSGQSILIKNGTNDISTKKTKLSTTPGLVSALSAQARLDSITALYARRTLVTKLMAAFGEVSPSSMQLNSLKYGAIDGTIAIAGKAKSYAEVAKLDRALEAAHISLGTGSPSQEPYFTNVQLRSTTSSDGKTVDFTLIATVAPGAIHGN